MNNERVMQKLAEIRDRQEPLTDTYLALSLAINTFGKLKNRTIDEVLSEIDRLTPCEDITAENGDYPKSYIIHIAEEIPCENGKRLYRARGFNSLVFDDNGLKRLQPYNRQKAIDAKDAAYDKGYKDGYSKGRTNAFAMMQQRLEYEQTYGEDA